MLDALEWAVNKTRLSDASLNARYLEEAALAEKQNSIGELAREVYGIGDDDGRITSLAQFTQPPPKSRQLYRREIPQVDQMHQSPRRRQAAPELLAVEIVARRPAGRFARCISEPANDALIGDKQAGDTQ